MNYYYAVGGQQTGPVSEEQLDQMVASGSLAPDTLIWAEGMGTWEPYSSIRQSAGATAASTASAPLQVATAPASNGVVCSVCNGIFPSDQVIRYGANYVCGTCKPKFVQGLREGTSLPGALNYASFGKRFAAKFLDGLIGYAIGFALGLGLQAIAPPNDPLYLMLNSIGSIALGLAYPIFFLGKWGQTLGKMALKIKVVTPEGGPIGYLRATGRTFAEWLSSCILLIGYLMAAWDDEKRTLHDRLASTRVIDVS